MARQTLTALCVTIVTVGGWAYGDPAEASTAGGVLSQLRMGEASVAALGRDWSQPKTRDGVTCRTAGAGNVFVSLPGFWGQHPSPPAGMYVIEIVHVDTANGPRPIKVYSGGGELGFRYVGEIRGTRSGKVVTDRILVNAEDIVTCKAFGWSMRLMLGRSRPADVVGIAVRRATELDVMAARVAAIERDALELTVDPTAPPPADVLEPGERLSYYRTTLEDVAKHREFLAGQHQQTHRRFDLYYAALERGPANVPRPATEAEILEYELFLKRQQSSSAPADGQEQLPYVIVAVVIRKPVALETVAADVSSGVVAFTRPTASAISRVYTKPTSEDVGKPLALRLAKDEWEGGHVLVWSQQPRSGLRLRVVTPTKDDQPLRGRVEAYYTSFGPVGKSSAVQVRPVTWWPQPSSGLHVEADRSVAFWVDVYAAADATAGVYRGKVEVVGADAEVLATLALEAEVLPFQLVPAANGPFKLGFFSGALPAPRMQRVLMEHNCNTFTIHSAGTQPIFGLSDPETLTVDYTTIENQLGSAGRLGFGPLVWILAARPEEFPQTMHLEKALLRASLESQGKVRPVSDPRMVKYLNDYYKQGQDRVTEPVRSLLSQWATSLADHATASGWPAMLTCPMDQPHRDWAGQRFGDMARIITESSQGQLGVFGLARQPGVPDAFADCGVVCITATPGDAEAVTRARNGKRQVWTYATCELGTTTFTQARRLAGVSALRSGSDGVLFWALEWGRSTPWRYVAGEAVYGSALVGIREGGDDRRYAETLLAMATDHQAARAAVAEAVQAVPRIPVQDMNLYKHDYFEVNLRHATRLDQMRRTLADEIVRLSMAGD